MIKEKINVASETSAMQPADHFMAPKGNIVGVAKTMLKERGSENMIPMVPIIAGVPAVIPQKGPKIIELLFEHLDFDSEGEAYQAVNFLRMMVKQSLNLRLNLRCLLYFGGGRVYELLRDALLAVLRSRAINLVLPAQARISGLNKHGVENLVMKEFLIATVPLKVPDVVLSQMSSLANQVVLSTGLNEKWSSGSRKALPILCSPADLMDLKYSMELEKTIVPFIFKPDGLTQREFDLLQNEVLSEAEDKKFYAWISEKVAVDAQGRDLLSVPADRSVFRKTINRWKYSQDFPTYFIATHCEKERGAETRNNDLFKFYWAICEAYKLPKPIDVAEFGRIMGRIGIKTSPRKHRDGNGEESTQRFYIGLRPKSTSKEHYEKLMPTEEELSKRLTDFYGAGR